MPTRWTTCPTRTCPTLTGPPMPSARRRTSGLPRAVATRESGNSGTTQDRRDAPRGCSPEGTAQRRLIGSVGRARGHLAHHHAVAQALRPVVGEALALVHRAGAVVEERRVLLPDPTGVVWVAFDQAA